MNDGSPEIMAATYRALCEHGYANLTMQDIADETERSKAALHYHYDGKRALLLAFLEYLYDEFTDRVDDPAGDTPAERLLSFVDGVLTPLDEEDGREAFGTAILELKAQAPYDDAIRERLVAFDEFLVGRIRGFVTAGIEAGEFREVDPDDVAGFVVTVMDGARTKQVAVGRDVAHTRRTLETYVETHLLADGGGHGHPATGGGENDDSTANDHGDDSTANDHGDDSTANDHGDDSTADGDRDDEGPAADGDGGVPSG